MLPKSVAFFESPLDWCLKFELSSSFLLLISLNKKYRPLYFWHNIYITTSRARFSWDNNLNCWREHFPIIDDAPYLTFSTNTMATHVVLYPMRPLHPLQAESELDRKLTTNNARTGICIGSQGITTFLGKEGISINYFGKCLQEKW